jgi:hypothetical protein
MTGHRQQDRRSRRRRRAVREWPHAENVGWGENLMNARRLYRTRTELHHSYHRGHP